MEGSLIGPYRILGDLGSGGMGAVYLAELESAGAGLDAGMRVALKVIHPHLLETPGFFKRFLREAQIGRSVAHPNVVRCFDCDALAVGGHQQHFLVMEYVEGQTLRGLLEEMGTVPEELCRHVAREVAQGLVAIHGSGVIHRDLKPENVMITPDHVVKVMDLGVARLQDEVIRLSQSGTFAGSLEYAAPEQLRSAGATVDVRTDLHALGLILYELSTHKHPYRAEHTAKVLQHILEVEPRRVGSLNPQLSPFFEILVATLIAKDPDDRFASAAELCDVLDEGEASAWWQERARTLRRETRRPLRQIRIPRETALYGRSEDLVFLQSAYGKTQAGDGQVVLLQGEAGIGKTRLVETFVRRLQDEGEDPHVLYGSYPPGGAATAAGAWSTAYGAHFGVESLEETLGEHLTAAPALVPAFAALLRGEPPPAGAPELTKDSLQTVFIHATRSLSRDRPTVVVIDDLHFAPEGGRGLLAALALAVPGHRILLLGTMRPGVPEPWIAEVERHEHAQRLDLSRLGPRDLVALLKDAFQSERLAQQLGVRIAEKSDGNPFFAFEIIRGLKEEKVIVESADGSWIATSVIDEIQVPSSVQDLVNARVAELPDEERDLLDVASCCGFEFDPGLVADALDLARLPALKRLGRIERARRLIRTVGRLCVFDHHQVQESLYQGLMPQLRAEYHAALGDALERRTPEPEGREAVALCRHFLEGGRADRARVHLDRALDSLENRYRNEEAARLTEAFLGGGDLLDGADRVRVLLRRNARLDFLGRREEQAATLEEALALAETAGSVELLAEVETAAGMLAWSTARYEEAGRHHERALELARECGDERREATAMGNLGRVHWARGQYADAQRCFEADLRLSTATGSEAAATRAMGNLGLVHQAQGRYDEARDHFERWLEKARAVGDRRSEAIATGNLGTVCWATGRYPEARELFESWIELSRAIGDRQGEAKAVGNLGAVSWIEGFNAKAEAYLEEQMLLAREIGDRRSEAIGIGNLGAFQVEQGRYEEGRRSLEKALARQREIGLRQAECMVLGNLGVVAHRQGRLAEARRHQEDRLALAAELGDAAGTAESLLALAAAEMDIGEVEAAIQHLEKAHAIGQERGIPSAVLLAATHRASLPGGDVEAALEAYERFADAVGPAARLTARFHLWCATEDRAHLADARRMLDELAEHAAPEHREALLRDVPLHREIVEASDRL